MVNFQLSYQEKFFTFFTHNNGKEHFLMDIIEGRTYPRIKNVEAKVIVDIGANIGAASIFFANTYPSASIYSFEPVTINFDLLKKNTSNFKNIKIFKNGIFSEEKLSKINVDPDTPGRSSILKDWTNKSVSEDIKLVTLENILGPEIIKKIDILKIDTEGCETQIVSSIEHYLLSIRVIYLEYHSSEDRNKIINLMENSHRHIILKENSSKSFGEIVFLNRHFNF